MMDEVDPLYKKMEPWLDLKLKEFHKLGYNQIYLEDLWRYVKTFCWKNEIPAHYYQQISYIMALTPNDYLDFASLEAQVYLITDLDEMNLDDLF